MHKRESVGNLEIEREENEEGIWEKIEGKLY